MAECWVIKSHRLQVYIRDQSSLFLWDIKSKSWCDLGVSRYHNLRRIWDWVIKYHRLQVYLRDRCQFRVLWTIFGY